MSEIEKKVCTCAWAVYSLIGRFDGGKKRNPTGENRFHSRETERLSIHCRYLQIAANSMSRSLVRGRITSYRGLSSLNPLLIRGILCFSKRSAKTSSFVVHKKFLTRGSVVKQANIWTFLSDIDLIWTSSLFERKFDKKSYNWRLLNKQAFGYFRVTLRLRIFIFIFYFYLQEIIYNLINYI